MEQRAVIRFFTFKARKAKNIHPELESMYGTEALGLLTGKKWPRRFQQGRKYLFDDPRSGRPLTNDFGEAITSILTERPFSWCKVL
jgi:hypothetical protein